MTTRENEGFEFAYLGNADNSGGFLLGLFSGLFGGTFLGFVIALRRDPPEVGMIAGIEPTTPLAITAGRQIRSNRLAEQKRGKLFRESGLADSRRPDQKDGMRETVEPLSEQLIPYQSVPV